MSSERVMIFIDGANFYRALKNEYGKADIDFEKFQTLLVEGRKHIRTYYYNATVDQSQDKKRYAAQQRFFQRLEKIPYFQIHRGYLSYRGGVLVEKGVDVKLAVDMIRFAYLDNYDTAILVSGDGDFSPAVELIQDSGKHVENATFTSSRSHQLRQKSDRFISLDKPILDPLFPATKK